MEQQRIGLDVNRKTLFGCLGVFVFLVALLVAFGLVGERHGAESSRAAADRMYSLARVGDYDAMGAVASKSAVLTMRKADAVNGSLSDWKVFESGAQLFGRPGWLAVAVSRGGKPFVDEIALQDSIHVSVVVEYPKEDWPTHRSDRAVRVIAP